MNAISETHAMIAAPFDFDNLEAGAVFTTRSVQISEAEIFEYASKWDPQPFHLDREAGAASIFGALTASGLHTLSQSFLLYHELGLFKGTLLGGNAMDEVRWQKPVFVGDTLSARVTILSKHPISRPDRGFVKIAVGTVNGRGETVLSFVLSALIRRRVGQANKLSTQV